MENKQAYTFVKNIRGSLHFTLDSYNMQLPTKDFFIPYNADRIIVPFAYALGLFISDGALTSFNQGCFTIEDYESLKAAAEEVGFLPSEKPTIKFTIKEIEKILLDGKIEKVKEVINSKDFVSVNNLLVLAHEHLKELPSGIIRVINESCGVELEIDE